MKTKADKPKKVGRPPTGQMPHHIFRMADEDWQKVVEAAESLGETVSEFTRRTLLRAAASALKKKA